MGAAAIDGFLQQVATAVGAAAPRACIALYVTGSHASGDAVATSDVDLQAIVHESTRRDEVVRLVRAARAVAGRHRRRLDLAVLRKSDFARSTSQATRLRLGARRIAGEDVAALVPLPPMARYVADRMDEAACLVAFALRERRVRLPLEPPDAHDRFLGYAHDGTTRDMVTIVGWAATALVAERETSYVASKVEALTRFAASRERFSPLAERLLARVRRAWSYRVPDADDEREELAAIAREVLELERWFLERYEAHLARRAGRRDDLLASALGAMLEDA